MIIKKFQAKTEEEATAMAQKELGANVVIMSVKKVKKKGLFKVFKPNLVEVTAALEEEVQKPQPKPQEGTPILSEPVSVIAHKDIIQEESKEETAIDAVIEEKLNSLQNLLEEKLKPEEERQKESTAVEEEKQSESVIFMKLLYNTMMENEVDEQYANMVLDEMEKVNKENMPIDYILAHIYQKLILKFGQPVGITPASKGPKVIFFIGPTGVGKTTTIAKIASKFSVDEKKKVALLTADTYRIAAAEQLRTYANILEVPFRVIYTVEEIKQAIIDFKDYDYIMVDTAGHSHHNEAQTENMKQLLHSVDEAIEREVFLVVSATTKYRDLLSITDTYAEMTEYKLIFTKIDETTTLGNLLNLKLYTGAPLSYITCGQNVPDDIESFNPQSTVKQLLGGKNR